jgi:PIN domain nuclease of toxin-antitoxin system
VSRHRYILDTHALLFWYTRESVSESFIQYFDRQNDLGNLLISAIAFWELALLKTKGKIEIDDLDNWKNELLVNTRLEMVVPSSSEMIRSVELPDFHKDPFDRLLVIQAKTHNARLVTKDKNIAQYPVKVFWKE